MCIRDRCVCVCVLWTICMKSFMKGFRYFHNKNWWNSKFFTGTNDGFIGLIRHILKPYESFKALWCCYRWPEPRFSFVCFKGMEFSGQFILDFYMFPISSLPGIKLELVLLSIHMVWLCEFGWTTGCIWDMYCTGCCIKWCICSFMV